jgi:hypothetical protein
MRLLRTETGQATVELVALLPVMALLAALVWQALLAGEAIWLDGAAARAAARAAAIGGDPSRAARAVLPRRFAARVRVRRTGDGSVTVAVGIPLVLGDGTLASASTRARFEAQR